MKPAVCGTRLDPVSVPRGRSAAFTLRDATDKVQATDEDKTLSLDLQPPAQEPHPLSLRPDQAAGSCSPEVAPAGRQATAPGGSAGS